MSERLTLCHDIERLGGQVREALDRLGVKPGEAFYVTALGGRARARRTDPVTSHQAAANLDDLRQSQRDVLLAFDRYGAMTDERLLAAMNALNVKRQSPSGVRSRRAELVAFGFLVDTGEKAMLASGNDGIVWGPIGQPINAGPEHGALF